MFCRSVRSNRFWFMLIVVGIVTLIFSIIYNKGITNDAHNMNMLMGMFFGIGSTFTVIGIIKLIRYKRISAEELRIEEIELKDERNIQVLKSAYTTANTTSTVLFILMVFVFVWLDYRIPAFISLGAMQVQSLAFLIGHRYFNNKM